MTEPDLTPEQRAAQVERMRGEADAALSALRERMAQVGAVQQAALARTAQATSRDGGVRATVDATGVVLDLEFTEQAMHDGPQRLAAATVATIQNAATRARQEMTAALQPLTGPSAEALAAARRNVEGLSGLAVPRVPHTAEDPTEEQPAQPETGYAFEEIAEPQAPAPASTETEVPPRPARRRTAEDDDQPHDSIYGDDAWA